MSVSLVGIHMDCLLIASWNLVRELLNKAITRQDIVLETELVG